MTAGSKVNFRRVFKERHARALAVLVPLAKEILSSAGFDDEAERIPEYDRGERPERRAGGATSSTGSRKCMELAEAEAPYGGGGGEMEAMEEAPSSGEATAEAPYLKAAKMEAMEEAPSGEATAEAPYLKAAKMEAMEEAPSGEATAEAPYLKAAKMEAMEEAPSSGEATAEATYLKAAKMEAMEEASSREATAEATILKASKEVWMKLVTDIRGRAHAHVVRGGGGVLLVKAAKMEAMEEATAEASYLEASKEVWMKLVEAMERRNGAYESRSMLC
eukprot:CAMPEP_0113240792 /NCGR_PEP_ID=MMETSP0008_2-20120614/6455_1 /TAXON_ID=97485 /ORGANISM="Prymnesium parvum" /LENGTH=276 /DNA_ID=CAMNT_0000088163 /DNA_START=90 /DNA_END=922 /DNA_ORIENTATION=+ /assembly_acc=CAM_ASM_000153